MGYQVQPPIKLLMSYEQHFLTRMVIFKHNFPLHTPIAASATPIPFFLLLNHHENGHIPFFSHSRTRRRRRTSEAARPITAAEKRESHFEMDPDKARKALEELDQQLQSLSQKQVASPKIKASSLSSSLREQVKEENPELSGSFLTAVAFMFFAFTIFYNILFITVIKPSIDGPDEVAPINTSTVADVPETRFLQQQMPTEETGAQ
ncbi:hypothetical protein Ancab_024672 [Ancistrocladus abbreviatus]